MTGASTQPRRDRKPAAFFVVVGVPIAAVLLSMALLGVSIWSAPPTATEVLPQPPMSKTSWRGEAPP